MWCGAQVGSRELDISVYCHLSRALSVQGRAVKVTGWAESCGPPASPPPSPPPPPHLLPSRGETGSPPQWDGPLVDTTGTSESETGILGTNREWWMLGGLDTFFFF